MSAYDKVKLARSKDRLTGKEFIENIFTDFIELHGDRRFADDGAIVGGIALLRGKPVTVIATNKGREVSERVRSNFGAPNPEGYRKALRLMKQAEKFHRPVVCFVDTPGAHPGIGAEERGQGQAIAENLMEMMTLKTPIISVLVGEGGSGGALALAVADEVWMLENAIYSVISVEGCASILWKDAGRAPEAAECLKISAEEVYQLGLVERIVPETDMTHEALFDWLEANLAEKLDEEAALPVTELTERRYARFRRIGAIEENV